MKDDTDSDLDSDSESDDTDIEYEDDSDVEYDPDLDYDLDIRNLKYLYDPKGDDGDNSYFSDYPDDIDKEKIEPEEEDEETLWEKIKNNCSLTGWYYE